MIYLTTMESLSLIYTKVHIRVVIRNLYVFLYKNTPLSYTTFMRILKESLAVSVLLLLATKPVHSLKNSREVNQEDLFYN